MGRFLEVMRGMMDENAQRINDNMERKMDANTQGMQNEIKTSAQHIRGEMQCKG